MKHAYDDRLLSAVKELVAMESTAENPAGLKQAYDFIKQRIVSCGKDITIEEFRSGNKPSLLAYRGKVRPKNFRIILNGHLDVVPGSPEQFQPYVKDGKLHGRGTYDMKAAALVLTDVYCEKVDEVSYPIALQIVTDEESAGVHGVQHQIKQGVHADFVICGDCGRAPASHTIVNEAKGNVWATVEFQGAAAHGAYPWKGDNAALKAARFVHTLHEQFPTPEDSTRGTTITVTSIVTHGSAANKVPERASATIDARYPNGDPNFVSQERFIDFLKKIDTEIADITIQDFASPLHTNPSNPLLLALKASAEKIEGTEFTFDQNCGTSDGRHFSTVGIEACEFGIEGVGQHGNDEYIPLAALYSYQAIMRDFLQRTSSSAFKLGADSEQTAPLGA